MNIRIGRKAPTPEPCGHVSVIRPAVDPVDRAHCEATLAKADPCSALADYLAYRLESGDRLTGGAQ